MRPSLVTDTTCMVIFGMLNTAIAHQARDDPLRHRTACACCRKRHLGTVASRPCAGSSVNRCYAGVEISSKIKRCRPSTRAQSARSSAYRSKSQMMRTQFRQTHPWTIHLI